MLKVRSKEIKPRRKKGTGCINRWGYIVIPNPRVGQMAQHRLVMENYLGRPLEKHEKVHHLNGVRTDNRLENLELWTTAHPTGSRLEDKLKWCRDFLNAYENKVY